MSSTKIGVEPKKGTSVLVDVAIANIESHKPTTIVTPTALDVRKSAKYVVNANMSLFHQVADTIHI